MVGRAVVTYDPSSRAGWAVYSPELDEPVFGVLRLPPNTSDGDSGPAFKLFFDHITWVNRRWPLAAIGYEGVILPTGGKSDDDKRFVTSPTTIKRQVGLETILVLCAELLTIPGHSINNASWRRYWLGSQPRGTQRDTWKELSVAKARGLGWDVKGDDDADALGQLHFLLSRLEIKTRWGRNPSRELIELGYKKGVPIHA
jgi:hypothetical protein